MTREEAIRLLDPETTAEAIAEIKYYAGFNAKTASIQAITEACELAVADMRKQITANLYEWHDLRKNPDDLPDKNLFWKSLLCLDRQGRYMTDCNLYWDSEQEWFESESDGAFLVDVIAWKEIEPFEADGRG